MTDYELHVIEAVASDRFATIDIRKLREATTHGFRLDDSFIAQYTGREPEWGELGWFTFKRTYARRVGNDRTEEWTEVVRRVVEGNLSIIPNDPLATQEYGQKMFDLIWNLVFTPGGRGIWISGTEFSKRSGDALVNCWAIETKPQAYGTKSKIFTRREIKPFHPYVSYPFTFMFDMSMKGGGVGFSAEQNDVDALPKVRNACNLYLYVLPSHEDYGRLKEKADALGIKLNVPVKTSLPVKELTIADSREGWCEALAMVIDEHFYQKGTIVTLRIDLSEIRPFGKPIKGFGGVASGSAPLMELLHFFNTLLNKRVEGKLSTTDIVDMYTSIGRAVVAGNVRRTATIALGSPHDTEFANLKNYTLYDKDDLTEEEEYHKWAQRNHRWASNNTVIIDDPKGYDFNAIAPAISVNGEPGILNRYLMQNFGRIIDGKKKKIDKAKYANPCSEISLESEEPCNLVELMLPVMLKKNIDPSEVIPFMVQYAKRVTFAQYEWEGSYNVISRNRRLGISLTGVIDWILLKYGASAIAGWRIYDRSVWNDQVWRENFWYEDVKTWKRVESTSTAYDPATEVAEPIYRTSVIEELDRMYKVAKRADIELSELFTRKLGYQVDPSIKITTNKPSGTVALLPGVSPGIHYHYFSHGIRRIQVQSNDPLLKLAEACGLKTEPSSYSPGSHCIEFPVKSPSADVDGFRSADKLTIEEQFALQAMMSIYWADNMVSCTIYFKQEEASKIADLLTQYHSRIKSTSLLPYSGHGYVQAPYEPLTKEEYEKRRASQLSKPEHLYHTLMTTGELQDREMTLSEAVECLTGACPVR